MATKKPAKSSKKTSTKPKDAKVKAAATSKKTVNAEVKEAETKKAVATEMVKMENEKVFKGFFKKKYDTDESILTIFKTKKIWGALFGELIGTALLSVLLLTLGVQPLYVVFGALCITLAVFALSGANLNPAITVGMMITRRMSAIRGVLYIVAQIVGAWIGLLIVNSFRLASGTETELTTMTPVTGESFWFVAMVELVGMVFLGFFFVRALHYKRSALTFALLVTSGFTFAIIFGIVVSQSFYEVQNSFIYNPAVALMYQILPSSADSFGALAGTAALELLTYFVFPMVGCTAGFLMADAVAAFGSEEDNCCCKVKSA